MSSHSPRAIELLAPAKDLETALAAIAHGADAVYIGAPKFGARASAGVPLEDIKSLVEHAHLYGVRIYVTLNTILYDNELLEVEELIWQLWRSGVDALIVQDMGITKMHLPPIPLHASTQCDTIDADDARQLEAIGFEQIVLARELNTEQIGRIYAAVEQPLEVFVHGALCVSYSGRCYLSEAETKRSANRGACSQQCRLPYDLVDATGRLIRQGEHLLSPIDLNRGDMLEALLAAGASSLKIEGRLKSISYVKNVTAYYRQRLDTIISAHPDLYRRASQGRHTYGFSPNPAKSFNRGFTDYQWRLASSEQSSNPIVINPHSPKSQGEYLGVLERSKRPGCYRLSSAIELTNGDGLLYIDVQGRSGGFKVNRVYDDGSFSPAKPLRIPYGSRLYRNYDQAFERQLAISSTAQRRHPIALKLTAISSAIRLDAHCLDLPRLEISVSAPLQAEPAKRFDPDRIKAELSKLGDTIFCAETIDLDLGELPPFVPLSLLSQMRRDAATALQRALRLHYRPLHSSRTQLMKTLDRSALPHRPRLKADYRANIANRLAREHYQDLGYREQEVAYELSHRPDAELMCTKHCLRHYIGYCTRQHAGKIPYREPLYLVQRGQRLRLAFDCKHCQMLIYRDETS